jgi:hypothetical protein
MSSSSSETGQVTGTKDGGERGKEQLRKRLGA